MFSTIILRDIPKEIVQIDLLSYEIQGGFRGFHMVPAGLHYVSILANGTDYGFWLNLPPNEVVIKVFDSTQKQFVDDEPDSANQYRELAASGAMAKTLLPYPQAEWLNWWKLTQHISFEDQLPQLHQETASESPINCSPSEFGDWIQQQHKSRFELAFFETHKGDASAFLAEFQLAFVRWLISSEDNEDVEAFTRWQHLLVSIYNAGEYVIAQHPQLFCDLIDTLLVQFNYLPPQMLTPDSFISTNAKYLAEDMIDTDLAALVEKGQEFSNWLDNSISSDR